MSTRVTLIPGDGIGPEIVRAVCHIFDAAGAPIEWEEHQAGADAYEQHGELLPEAMLSSIQRNGLALKGPIATPLGKGFRSVNVQLRSKFNLYTNLRPVRSLPGVKARYDDIDMVLFRENLEGLYAGLELYDERREMVDSVRRITRAGCERIVRASFEYAKKNGRKKLALFHKANIMKQGDGMFLRVGQMVAQEYPEIAYEEYIIDNAFMQLVMNPHRFEVIVTTNMFGDIVSDLLAGMVGGLGVVSGANLGDDAAIFEAVHGSAPDIAGKGIANPMGLLLSAIMMLHHLGYSAYAERIETALHATLQDTAKCTPDLGGQASTMQFAESIAKQLAPVSTQT